jgi:biotin carboxylase
MAFQDRNQRLAFSYHPWSFSWMSIREAAKGRCDLIWVFDREIIGTTSQLMRVLGRTGDLVDVTGLDLADATEAVISAKPDAILALADPRLEWTAAVADRAGMRFISPKTAQLLTDKHAQRSALRAAGLPTPAARIVPSRDDALAWQELRESARFPAILKPRRGEASSDTVRIDSLRQLEEQVSALAEARGEPREMILEEYLADRSQDLGKSFAGYVSVESVVSHGEISHLTITGRFPPAEPFRESGFFMPAALSAAESAEVLQTATAALSAVGMETGCAHTEIKFTPDGPRVIEINGRIGGGVPEMLFDASGVDLMSIAFRIALGEHITYDKAFALERVGYLFYVHAPIWMRNVHGVDGLDQLRAAPGVNKVIFRTGAGGEVNWRDGNHGHVFSVRGVASDHTELERIANRITAETEIHGA